MVAPGSGERRRWMSASVMTGAGSIEESGYVFMGEVTPADLRV